MAAFKRLLSRKGNASETWKCVSRLSADELPMALETLRETLKVTASETEEESRLLEIESAIYFRWAESDPHGALKDVSAMEEPPGHASDNRRSNLLRSVLAAWMKVDADGAYRAVKDHEDFGYVGRNILVKTWTPENVFERANLHPEKHADLLGWYCVGIAANETARNAMLSALEKDPGMKDGDRAKFMLFRAWGYRDFDAAVTAAEERKFDDTVQQLLKDNLGGGIPGPALRWAAKNHIPPGGSLWEKSYENWLGMDRPSATAWFSEQMPVWESQGHHAAVASFLAEEYGSAPADETDATGPSAGDRLRTALATWKQADPVAAAKWLDTAPSKARKLLSEQP